MFHKNKLSAYNISKLNGIKQWSFPKTNKQLWDYTFDLLCEYIKINKKLPEKKIIYKNRKLGMWVQIQRESHNKGTLNDYRKNKLESIDIWVWSKK